MVAIYNPQDARYRDERSVRLEVSRVFDVCNSCRKCLDLCSVFPHLVDTVGALGRGDGGLLTPIQQDEVLQPCTMCMQCVTQCPEPVHFPSLVLRHRAMLWVSQYLGVRQKAMAFCVGRSATWIRRLPFLRSFLWGLTAKFEWLPELPAAQNSTVDVATHRQGVSQIRGESRAVLFSTCPVDLREPWVIADFVATCDRREIECAVSKEFICCGAPDLYAGNISRFRKVARKNRALLDAYRDEGHRIIVGKSSCMATMLEMYPLYLDSKASVCEGEPVVDLDTFLAP